MIIGRVIGVIIGFFLLNIVGAIIGFFVGNMFDTGLQKQMQNTQTGSQGGAGDLFFTTVFQLLGFIAKSDGRVSEEEVTQTEQLMGQMGLTAEHRREAIRLFKLGSEPEFDAAAAVQQFSRVSRFQPQLKNTLLTYLIGVAMADGVLDPGEEKALETIASQLGMPAAAFAELVRMLHAQGQFRGRGQASSATDLATAYEALGVSSDVGDKELKKRYRSLMSQNHPDKLMGQGVPDDMIKVATERSQEIQAAYDLIKQHRKQS